MVKLSLLNKKKTFGINKKLLKNIRTKWTGFINWPTGLIRWRTGFICQRIKPVRRWSKPVRQRIKPIHLVLIFLLNWPIYFLVCSYLLVFSCPKRNNNIILMSINCLFFQDRHGEIVNYPFNELFKELMGDRVVCRAAPGFARVC